MLCFFAGTLWHAHRGLGRQRLLSRNSWEHGGVLWLSDHEASLQFCSRRSDWWDFRWHSCTGFMDVFTLHHMFSLQLPTPPLNSDSATAETIHDAIWTCEELNGFLEKKIIPAHPGFEILLRECFGLDSRPRKCLGLYHPSVFTNKSQWKEIWGVLIRILPPSLMS